MKYSIVTFGCRVNQADSLAIDRDLRARGAVDAPIDHADLVIVNTCSVTATADQGARQTIRRIVRINPDARIVVTGCYATRQPGDLAGLPNVVRIVPNQLKDGLVALMDDDGELTTAERFGSGDGACGAPLVPGVAGRTALTLRVQTGCEERCSYCIIPQTRGAGRSRALAHVRRDIQCAVDAGYKEIAITGVHLGSYGRDRQDGSSLTTLVQVLASWPSDVLFRISSLEPMDCTPAIVDAVATSPRMAPHFHLPLQHGCNSVLARMRRPYAAGDYRALVECIHESMPHASIGSDVIVGFPGETDAEFATMCRVVEQLPLTHLHVFPYSDRPDTSASAMHDKVDGVAVRERGRVVRAIGERMARRFRESLAGSVRRALTVDDGWSAVTDNYIKVRLDRQHRRNEWVDVAL